MSIFDIPRGMKQQRFLSVPGLDAELPVTVIRGQKDGARVLLTAGIHCEEYTGIETANRLATELSPEKLIGCVCIIHVCNPTGFVSHSRDIVPEDGKNLNRCFPGSADSSAAPRLAHFITNDFIIPASCHIDLHCGGGCEELTPHVYFQQIEPGSVTEASKKLAALMDAKYMVPTKAYTGSAFSHAAFHGVPSVLLERGGMAQWTETDVDAYLADVRRVLCRLGVLSDCTQQKNVPEVIDEVDYYNGTATGCWYPALHAGDMVKAGERLGVVKDMFGHVLGEVTAVHDGVILYQVGSFSVSDGEFLVACGRV